MLGPGTPPRTATAQFTTAYQPLPDRDPAIRAVTAMGLIAVGIIHALQIPGQLSGAAWLSAGFWMLAVVAPLAGLWLLARPSPLGWTFGGLVCLLAGVGYILTRSVGLPGDPGDVGNWLEPMGIAALITEGVVVILAVLAVASLRSSPDRAISPWQSPPR
jgi:hypothetical protein